MTPIPFAGKWKWFQWREIREATAWADMGGVAIHENRASQHRKGAVHVFARDVHALTEVSRYLRAKARWLHLNGHHRIHLDLWGVQRNKAERIARGLQP